MKVYPRRRNPADCFTDTEFKKHFRLDKVSAERLVDILGLRRENNRGLPLDPVQELSICLNHFAGGQFQRISGMCEDVSASTAHTAIQFVRQQILELKSEFIRLLTPEECRATACYNAEKFRLPGFAYAIDGVFVNFNELPRGIPVGPGYPNKQSFFNRKHKPAINVLILGKGGRTFL